MLIHHYDVVQGNKSVRLIFLPNVHPCARLRAGSGNGAGTNDIGSIVKKLFLASLLLELMLASSLRAQTTITAAERVFFGAALSYLKTANAEGSNLAKTMVAAGTGSITLSQMKTAISAAMHVENAGYEGDYKARIKGNVPASGAGIASQIDVAHRLFQAGLKEQLEDWSDQNTAHIVSGEKKQ
jgi:hypothetical protein